MKNSLLPLTRLIVLASGGVSAIFALIQIFAPGLQNSLIFPPPFEPQGRAIMLFTAASYLAFGGGMILTLRRNDWKVAQGFLAVTGTYNALCIVVSLFLAATPPGLPLIVWLYVLLAVIYLVMLYIAWRQQSA
jgi:magnesium-transporting ATPase (P-type)